MTKNNNPMKIADNKRYYLKKFFDFGSGERDVEKGRRRRRRKKYRGARDNVA